MDSNFPDPFDPFWPFGFFGDNSLDMSVEPPFFFEEEAPSTGLAPEVPLAGVEPHAQEAVPARKKSRVSFSTEAHREINQWFAGHASHPYQTKEQEDLFMIKYGMSRSQVRTAFNNRRRGLKTKEELLEAARAALAMLRASGLTAVEKRTHH
jgi:hypothetical protein